MPAIESVETTAPVVELEDPPLKVKDLTRQAKSPNDPDSDFDDMVKGVRRDGSSHDKGRLHKVPMDDFEVFKF